MATLAFAAAGAALGSAILPTGFSVLGATLTGATIGAQVGAMAGSFVDQTLFGASGQSRSYAGPRLSDLRVTASTEGAPVPRLFGRARLGGQVIWAADIEEETIVQSAGGKGAPRAGSQTSYTYFASFAVAIGEGEITELSRVWVDGRELDLTNVVYRFYTGSESQLADSLIAAYEGPDRAPAFRGIAYVVFERLALADFGNRLPQLSFEVVRPVDALHQAVRGVVMIPGSGEFVYATEPVTRTGLDGAQVPENVHTRSAATDWAASLDQMQGALPNAQSVSLVVSWFGTDLRAGACQIRPGVDAREKVTRPLQWSVAGEVRASAYEVSKRDGRAAYGGTPSDASVVQAIRDCAGRGLRVTLSPFILMDVADGNALSDPYTGAGSQPPYPWRGRITVDPAPGLAGSPDKTPAASAQVAALVGTAAVADFAIAGDTVVYSGPAEWSLRRMVLHYAHIAKAAGGVDAFVIASELRALTRIRDGATSYPFVAALVALAADVRTVLGPATKITYAADWSEVTPHQAGDGSGDVLFHLDPLWSSPAIDAIGIDLYWPLADWRDGGDHADAATARSIYDLAYLKANLAGGEGFDWYYASDADRGAQLRTPITDGAGKPWVFRYKDLVSWWSNPHFDRPGGVEQASPTQWHPQSKPIWFTEVGCPAVDKGANQPNVFVDPKSVESALPYFSNGRRDDLAQRRYLQALLEGFDPEHAGHVAGLNPTSTVTGQRMVDVGRIHVYAWDARPFPAFPHDGEVWGDGANWPLGHWLNGRLASAPLADLVARLLASQGFTRFDVAGLEGIVPGYAIDRIMSVREALQPLEMAYFFDIVESDGRIAFRHRGRSGAVAAFDAATVVEPRAGAALIEVTRAQETDLAGTAKISYVESSGSYRSAVAEARRLAGASVRVAEASLPTMLDSDHASALALTWLHESWAARERLAIVVPPSALAVEPGDRIDVTISGRVQPFRVIEIGDHGAREIAALSLDPAVYDPAPARARATTGDRPPVVGTPDVAFLDLPLLRGNEPETAGYVAVSQRPWPGAVAIYRSPDATGFSLAALAARPAVVGRLASALGAGPSDRIDRANSPIVEVDFGELQSVSMAQMLAGANLAGVEQANGWWELSQFEAAELIAPRTYRLTGLLRAQAGSDPEMSVVCAAGSRFVLIDPALVRLDLAADELARPFNWRIGAAAKDIASASYSARSHGFVGLGRRPLSPVHVKARITGGDVELSWIRRTRRGGDGWEQVEVPLDEPTEAYEVDILVAGTPVRTLAASAPRVIYAAAAVAADHGSPPAALAVSVVQLSPTWGRGAPRTVTVPVAN